MSALSDLIEHVKTAAAHLLNHEDPQIHDIGVELRAKASDAEHSDRMQAVQLAHSAENDAKMLTEDAKTAAEPVERESAKTAAVLAAEATADVHKDA